MSDITANVVVSMPSQLFTAARYFRALTNGKIYIGKIDTDPTDPANQIQVYLENEDGTHVPVPQPIRINAGGYPVYNGQIVKFVTVEGHSMAVYDAFNVQQFYFPNVLKYEPDQAYQRLIEMFAGNDGFKFIGQCPDVETLRTIEGDYGQKILLRGYYEDSLYGGGSLVWQPDAISTDDGGVFFRVNEDGGWLREDTVHLSLYHFGGLQDQDCTNSIQRYVNWAAASSGDQQIGNLYSRFYNGITVNLSGSWGITDMISVPKCNNVRIIGGVIGAMQDFNQSAKCMFSFSENAEYISYEGCSWDGVTLSANHRVDVCLEVNHYNRFTIEGGAIFTGFRQTGLFLGSAQTGTGHEGHEFISNSMFLYEYDYFDTRRGSETGTAIEVYTNDNQIGGFTVSSAKQAILCPVPGNVFHNFHVWGISDKDWAIEIAGGSTTGTKLTNFKLGASRIVALSPTGISISDWNGEHVTTDFTNRFEYIWLKPASTNQNMRSVSVTNGKIQVAQPSGGGIATYETWAVTAKSIPNGGFERVRVTNSGSGYTTASVVVSGGGGGSGAVFEARVINGYISRVRVIESGSGYAADSTVSIVGDGAGATLTCTVAQLTKSFGDVIADVYIQGNGIVGGGVEALNISPSTHRTFSSTQLSSVSNFPVSFEKKMLITGRSRAVAVQFLPATEATTKSPFTNAVIDFATQTVNVGTYTDISNSTPSTTSGTMLVTLDCTSTLNGE